MRGKLLIGFTVVTMSFTNMSHADFTFYSNTNSCDVVSGQWVGNGEATHLLGTCKYHGSGMVSAVDSKGYFSLVVSADKNSGHFLCPEHQNTTVTGTCINGVVRIKTEYGYLSGKFSQESGSAKGILTVSGTNVDVNILFNRAH